MIQGQFWSKIKHEKIFPGFIQGMNKKQMMKLFKSKVNVNMRAICIDGSQFDSSQKSELMELVDNRFWDLAESDILEILDYNNFHHVESSAKSMISDAKKYEHYMFTNIPGINGPRFSSRAVKSFHQVVPNYKLKEGEYYGQNWIYLPLKGTTFSGHPTRTTLGNTLRSLFYMYYYLE